MRVDWASRRGIALTNIFNETVRYDSRVHQFVYSGMPISMLIEAYRGLLHYKKQYYVRYRGTPQNKKILKRDYQLIQKKLRLLTWNGGSDNLADHI